MQRLDPTSIGDDYRSQVTVQAYGSGGRIDGVEFIALRHLMDEGGDFMELIRLNEHGALAAKPDMKVTQVNYSRVLPGAIKAFHLHFNQEDVWFVPPTDRLLIGLLDVRAGSPTYQQHMRFILGPGPSRMVYIPRGVAHGAANLWGQPAQIMYFVNQHFSLEEPDERRLPWDVCGADFWTIQPG